MTIFVIDDHPLMRDAIGMVLRRLAANEKIVEIDRVGMISAAVKEHGHPTMLSLDFSLPDTTGVSGIRQLKLMYPLVPLAVVSASPSETHERRCIAAGADIYIEKSVGSAELASAFRGLLQPNIDLIDTVKPREDLSRRQMQLLQLLDRGLSNRDIADKLKINEHTVKVHMWRLFKRINVKSRTQAVYYCRTKGIIS